MEQKLFAQFLAATLVAKLGEDGHKMEKLRTSQKELEFPVSHRTITFLKNGDLVLSQKKLKEVCDFLGLKLRYLA